MKFELCDATKKVFADNSFDVIYSRDCILHIYDKLSLFKSFLKWLKPGGILFITDYCCGKKPHSQSFIEYLDDRKYHLKTPQQYTETIKNAGFVNVDGNDATKQFIDVLQNELDKFALIKNDFINEFCEKDYEYIVKGWKSKIVRCNDGDQKWGSFLAYKPDGNDNDDEKQEEKNQSASKEFLDNHQVQKKFILFFYLIQIKQKPDTFSTQKMVY